MIKIDNDLCISGSALNRVFIFHHYLMTMRGKRLSDDTVKAIYTHFDKKKSQRQIAKDLCISLCAVQGALRRRFGDTLEQNNIKLGRRRCT